MALPSKLMYQNKRGITGFPCFREATACTSHLAPNMEAPVRPISFHGVMCTPVHSSQAIGILMGSSMDASRVDVRERSDEHTSEIKSLMRTSYDVYGLHKQINKANIN